MNMKKVNGEILWGAGDSIHKISFNAEVDTAKEKVDSLKLELDPQFLDDVLQNVYKAGADEALRLAAVQG
jgi:di/tripeptidase